MQVLRIVQSFTVAILAITSTAALPAADEVKTTSIRGTVILNGKPLAGRILFHLDKGQLCLRKTVGTQSESRRRRQYIWF
jgi:hypothetical protein